MKAVFREIGSIDLSPRQVFTFLGVIWGVGLIGFLLLVSGASPPTPGTPTSAPAPSTPSPMEVSVASAYKLCRMFDATGLGSRPCQVDGFNVNVTADMASDQARSFCAQIGKIEDKADLVFNEPRWRINVYSPYSGDSTIAFCSL